MPQSSICPSLNKKKDIIDLKKTPTLLLDRIHYQIECNIWNKELQTDKL